MTGGASAGGKKFEFLYHIADAKFRAYGSTIEEVFENAALALFNVMTDTSYLHETKNKQIYLTSPDIETLLVDWLSELLYLFEVDGIVFGKFRVDAIEKKDGDDGFSLSAVASGEPIDLTRHRFDTHVKAVTFHDLEVIRDDGFSVQIVVDV